jgi:CBS domain-containing protein
MPWPKKLKKIPAVKEVMTPFPYSIEGRETLDRAREMMAEHKIHHLPVIDQGILLGVISNRDLLRTLDQSEQNGEDPPRVADVPREDAYVVDLSAPLDRVLFRMAEERLGAALVVKDDRLAGIFTLSDACRYFAEYLRQQFPSSGGDEAA